MPPPPQLYINTVFLREISGLRAFFPDSSNLTFCFTCDVGTTIRSFYVDGPGSALADLPNQNLESSVVAATQSLYQALVNCNAAIWITIQDQCFPERGTRQIALLIWKYYCEGKNFVWSHQQSCVWKWRPIIHQYHWDYCYSILYKISCSWEVGADSVPVTSDSLQIEDSDGSRGYNHPCYWLVHYSPRTYIYLWLIDIPVILNSMGWF